MISPTKARKILHDGKVHGKPITESQRKWLGARASGYPVMKYSEGGRIIEFYKNGTAQQLWDKGWGFPERTHFLIDHYDMFSMQLDGDTNKYAQKFSHSAYKDLPKQIQQHVAIHHAMGFYDEGGRIQNTPSKMRSPYLTQSKKQLLSKITSIKEKMQKVKDPQVLESINAHIQKLEALLHSKPSTREKVENWKKRKTEKRLNRK